MAGGARVNHSSKSIAFRIFKYFTVFILIIMGILWLLQTLFLQTFYQQMKIRELYRTAEEIQQTYGNESFANIMTNLTVRSDMYIQIESAAGILYATTSANPGDRMNAFASRFDTEILKEKLSESTSPSIVLKRQMYNSSDAEAMIYATQLETDESGNATYLFIYSPLSVVSSTASILSSMLIVMCIVSILFGMMMSIIIARRLANPLRNITSSAKVLAEGRYDVVFDGTGCRETEELASTLNYAADELSKSDQLQKDLVANVSHDLKTPLTMVKSYAEMIRDLSGDNPEKRNRHLQVIISEADRLNDLVNDLTVLSKMQANVDALELEPVDLRQVAQQTVDSFRLHEEQDAFEIELESEGDTIAEADRHKISQVFANLIGNAIRYSSEDDRYVCVRIQDRGDTVYCEVEDRGQGIEESEQQSIWDRYYQSSRNLSRTTKGSGLGLSIVKQIFILHQAEYGVESKVGEGSRFWFILKKTLSQDSKENKRRRS